MIYAIWFHGQHGMFNLYSRQGTLLYQLKVRKNFEIALSGCRMNNKKLCTCNLIDLMKYCDHTFEILLD